VTCQIVRLMNSSFYCQECRKILIYVSVLEHVDQFLLRMPVRSAKGSSRRRSYLGKYVGGIESWWSDDFGIVIDNNRFRRLSVCRDRLPHR